MVVNDADFSHQLKRYALAKRISFAKAVKQQGRLVAVNLAFQTQPFGDGTAARQQGEGAVTRDIGRVAKTSKNTTGVIKNSNTPIGKTRTQNSQQAAKVFARLVIKGQNAQATEILQRLQIAKYHDAVVAPMDGGALHQAARHGSRRNVPRNQFVKLVVPRENTIASYQKKIIQRVGLAKAGWADCAKQLGGTRGIPGWVTRQAGKKARGSVLDKSEASGDEQSVTMSNHVPWIGQCLNAGQIQAALDIQREKMTKAIEIALAKA